MAASELPNVDPEPDATIPWSYEVLNAPQFSPGATDTSSADELPRGHPEAAAEQRHPNFPEPGHNSSLEQDLTDSPAQGPEQKHQDPLEQGRPDSLEQDVDDTPRGSTPFTPAEGRSANDASTVLGMLTPNNSPSKVPNSAAENLRSAP